MTFKPTDPNPVIKLPKKLDIDLKNWTLRQFQPWTLLDWHLKPIVEFTSFIDLKVSDEGSVATVPVEMGSFAAYNKTQKPKTLVATLAYEGWPDQINQAINKLEKLKASTDRFSVVTPFQEYRWLTLRDMEYAHKRENGAAILIVTLTMVEVIEVEPMYSSSNITPEMSKNPENASTIRSGRKQGMITSLSRVLKSRKTGAL